MKLYNTLTRSIETFTPRNKTVTLYVCGITPYDTTHLGHAFTYTTADILTRYLESQGHEVNYVQNVTDIDDDVLNRSILVREDWHDLVNRWTAHYIEDMKTLNVRPPDSFPRATSVISEIIESIKKLLEAGVAYEAGGSVYFDINRWPAYGKLSRISRDDMLPVANERGNKPRDPNKRDPLDFVLWQAQEPREPSWDSPWGPGRPGWHIECSTLCTQLLGETIDIHMGGSDLLFPHHESEIAQVEPVSGKEPFVRFWLHVAMVRHQGEKMSKSLKNLVMVRDLLKTWDPDALRLYLAMHHYRTPWEYNETSLNLAGDLARQISDAAVVPSGDMPGFDPTPHLAAFYDGMESDLDTPIAVNAMSSLTSEIMQAMRRKQDVREGQRILRAMASLFGMRLGEASAAEPLVEGWNKHLQEFSGE